MRDIESQVRKAVENGEIVEYISTPIYNGSDLIPMGVKISAKGDGGLDIFTTILNRK